MEDLEFEISGILTEEEATKLFEEQASKDPAVEEEKKQTTKTAEVDGTQEEPTPETVGDEKNNDGNGAVTTEGDGSSPSIYSSIASALKNDGIFPDFDDSKLQAVKTPEDFAELFESAITSKLDERQKRIDEALGNGVEPDTIRMYEQTLQYLGSVNEEVLSAEGEEGENLRKQLIYNDLLNRGYAHEKAMKEVEKAFTAGTDAEDAKDALASLTDFYKNGYETIQKEAKKATEEQRKAQKEQGEAFRKLLLEQDVKLGDTTLDKKTCQRVYDAVSKPIHKDEETGRLLTAVQKFQKDKPLEFLKQIGMWYILTDGGKNTDSFTKEKIAAEKNSAIKDLERKINSSTLDRSGSLSYVSGGSGDKDPLLSDGWKVGWGDN